MVGVVTDHSLIQLAVGDNTNRRQSSVLVYMCIQLLAFCKHIRNTIPIQYLYDMERKIDLHIEKLPEGYYLATSSSVQGLVAQGRTISETLEIARDVAKKLLEAQENS